MAELSERQKRFMQAKKLHEQAEKEKSFSYGTVDVPKFETVCLKKNKSQIIRLIGESLEMAKDDTDPILVNTSLIKGDDGKWFNLIWSDDAEHPMNKLKKTVIGKYKWNKDTRVREYDNKGIPVFERFMTNGITDNPYNQGMQPQSYILINCISRGENDTWCKDNKHTKLLCWDCMSKEVDGEIKYYPTYGIKKSLYSEIWDKKCTMRGLHFEDFDVLVRRLSKDKKMGDSYLCVNIKEEKSAITNWENIDGCKYLEYMNDDELSKEEESYERYSLKDIPFISKPTPCGVILKHLSKFIKEVDAQFGTSHYAEFVEWKAKEMEQVKADTATTENATNDASSANKEVEVEVDETPIENELPSEVEEESISTAPVKKVVKNIKPKAFNPMDLVTIFPAIANMKEEDRNSIIGYDENSGELQFEDGELASCVCDKTIMDKFQSCPYCGAEFEI